LSRLPGHKPGISGSTLGGSNIGISSYISSEKKEASAKVIKYITSEDMQIKVLVERQLYSPIVNLYDDEEICKKVNCDFFKSHQLIARPIHKTNDYDKYSEKIIKIFFDYLFKNKNETAIGALQKIDDLTKIYHISIKSKDSSLGLMVIIVISFISFIILFSSIFYYFERLIPFFNFLPFDLWLLTLIGTVLIIMSSITEYGVITDMKCQIRFTMQSLGFTLNIAPVFQKLIVNFPEENKISKWVYKHKRLFVLLFILIEIFLNGLMIIDPYSADTDIALDKQNFSVCLAKNIFTKVMIGVIFVFNFFVVIIISILIFVEWNIKETQYDIRSLTIFIYTDILLLLIYIIINKIGISKSTKYTTYFILNIIIYISVGITNYVCLFGYRILYGYMVKDRKTTFIKSIDNKFIDNESHMYSISKTNTQSIDYHTSYINDEDSNNTNTNNTNNICSYSTVDSNLGKDSSVVRKLINFHYREYNVYDNKQ